MRRSETIGVWKLVVIVCAAAAGAALTTNADQAATRHDGPSVTEERTDKRTSARRKGAGHSAGREKGMLGSQIGAPDVHLDRPIDQVVIPRRLRSTYEKTSPRIPSPDGVMALQGESAGVTCAQPAANCQERDNSAGIVSDRFNFAVAEDFRPQAGGDITQVCWWGAYFDFVVGEECQNVSSGTFQVRYYEDAGGVPAAAWLASFSVDEFPPTLTVTKELTGDLVAGGPREYEFTATHAPLRFEAGQCYWIEITNALGGSCSWLWEIAGQGNGRSLQDGNGVDPRNGYDHDDLALDDMAFCLDLALDDTTACVPPPPVENDCSGAVAISGEDTFAFDNFSATTTGPPHAACVNEGDDEQFGFDVWYCWTAPCTETAFVRTCDLTDVDSKIAVYDGCSCPPTDSNLLVCNDDLCGELGFSPLQSMVRFEAVAGRSYLIRVGTFPGGGGYLPAPGGMGELHITCGPPDNGACPDNASCCIGWSTPECSDQIWACNDEICCETVCACDPFCCECRWDEGCATVGFIGSEGPSGCGAELLCVGSCSECGNASAGDCCEDNGTPACSDEECCNLVGDCDPLCRDVLWDHECVNHNERVPGCDTATLCPDLCDACGDPAAGDCCVTNGTPACSDEKCCDLVCACDPFCCDEVWDDFCAIRNQHVRDCDAATLCPNLCKEPGDLDGDGDVDLDDYDEFIVRCFAGPGATTSDPACGPADFDDNGTVDLKDFAGFQNAFGAP